MIQTIDQIIDETIKIEGPYVNDPKDPGGETIWGVTVAVARKNGYVGSMMAMPQSVAHGIYKSEYFVKPGFAAVSDLFPDLAIKLFDIGVNCGPNFACTSLQRCLNVLNSAGKDYPDLKIDGNLGPTSINALKSYLAKRTGDFGRRTLLFMVAALQSVRYLELAEKNDNNERFEYGWQAQRSLYRSVPQS